MYILTCITLFTQILNEKRETAKGGKPRSKSNPAPPRDSRYVISHTMSADVPSHSSSVDSEDTTQKLKALSVDDASDSDSDCYVGPLEVNRAVTMSYAGDKSLDENEDSDEYDYPYIEDITRAINTEKSSPSQVRPQDTPVKAVRHNRVHVPKSASSDTNTSPDYNNSGTKKHELLSGPQHGKEKMVRTSSQVEILEPLFEAENYVKMHPANAMVKSHSCDDGRFSQSVSEKSETPGTTSVNSPMEHNNYKSINRLTIATDGMTQLNVLSEIFVGLNFCEKLQNRFLFHKLGN